MFVVYIFVIVSGPKKKKEQNEVRNDVADGLQCYELFSVCSVVEGGKQVFIFVWSCCLVVAVHLLEESCPQSHGVCISAALLFSSGTHCKGWEQLIHSQNVRTVQHLSFPLSKACSRITNQRKFRLPPFLSVAQALAVFCRVASEATQGRQPMTMAAPAARLGKGLRACSLSPLGWLWSHWQTRSW